ncbi:uncharacterized protein LACBIDRAFT_295149 [Laccaria bicolor S238N-H82]|uniref:Predicted protein n=1 Tax=Laccaria bicolor (strain S238N-H82 / ATCC MYA-4686) TaxID=486041 RepID=B0DNM0_LACBS|nr:uncharacterized protein LACBIDRAFT_295149 [Laccaria bicolor S238N-H82]EDR03742.1 predicted protein [Laccaria bicolor S238N-H82]|eukprot:XP_001885595.1 predicted protein [Laccaria bicolor S238N-H82]
MSKGPAPDLRRSHTASRYAQPCLSTLPPDVLIQIQTFLDPDDIISLRKVSIILFPECSTLTVSLSSIFETSQALCTVTNLRIVWINALRQVCLMHGINLSTFYPLENISQIELEHAAFSPFRFIKYARDDIPFEGDIKSVVTRILEPRLPPVFSTDENVPFSCHAVLLIPGGRFLFTDTIQHGVALWDLGIHAGIPMKLSPLAVLPTTTESFVRFTSPTPDSHGVYVCIEEQVNLNMNTRMSIYEIYPSSPDVAFRLTHSLKVTGTLDNAYIYRNTLACNHPNNLITVWDFIQNKAISWEYDVVLRPNGVILFNDTLLLVEVGRLTVWDVPSSLYLPVSDDVEAAFIRLLPRLEIRTPSPAEPFRVSPPSHWLSAGQSRIPFFGLCSPTLDLQGEEIVDDYYTAMRCYTFKSVSSLPDNPDLQVFDPQHVGVVNSFHLSTLSEDFLRHIRFCDTSLTIAWQVGDDVNIGIMKMPQGDPDSVATPAIRRLFNGEEVELRDFDFCPAAGRLVVTTAAGDIQIMDFLTPPSPTRMNFKNSAEDHSKIISEI